MMERDDDHDLDPERRLALQYARGAVRDRLAAIWSLDARMKSVFFAARDPAFAQIKLAWWEERLAGLTTNPAPAEPLLRRLATVATNDAEAGDLVRLAGAWRELDAPPWSDDAVRAYAQARGRGLSAGVAMAVGIMPGLVPAETGEGYALVDLATCIDDPSVRAALLAAASNRFELAGRFVWPRALRPFGMLVELARGDAANGTVSRPGSPRRVARMAWHALTGR